MSEVINNAIKAIKADAGFRMKMGHFCGVVDSGKKTICNTSYCLAGWIVAGQPSFDKAAVLKDLHDRYGDPVDQTWGQAVEEGSLDSYLQDKADRMLMDEFTDDSINVAYSPFNTFDLFYLIMEGDSDVEEHKNKEEMISICLKLGVIEKPSDFVGNLSAFDEMPPQVRMDAAIKVLEILRDEKKIDWIAAIRYAAEKYACNKSVW